MKKHLTRTLTPMLLAFFLIPVGCNKPANPAPPILSSDKSIKTFLIAAADNPGIITKDINGVVSADSILLTFGKTTPLTSLVPTIDITGKRISPASRTAEDFSKPLSYQVTAEDGSTHTYTVVVKLNDSAKSITAFSFLATDNTSFLQTDIQGQIKGDTINMLLPAGMTNRLILPSIQFNGASISPANRQPQDFSGPVTYTVTAQDGTTRNYIVIVRSGVFPYGKGTLYIGDSTGAVYAIDAGTASRNWTIRTDLSITGSPTYVGGTLYVPSGITGKGSLFALDLTGSKSLPGLKWSYQTNGIITTPTFANGSLYAGCSDDYVYCVNAASGQLSWKYQTGDAVYSSPTVVNGTVYFGSDDNKLYALDATTGSLKWTFQPSTIPGTGFRSSPAVSNGILVVGCNDGNVYGLDAATGTQKWKWLATSPTLGSSPVIVDGIAYISTGGPDPFFLAIDITTGSNVGAYTPRNWERSGAAVSDGVVYIGAGYTLTAMLTPQCTWKWSMYFNNYNVSSFTDPIVFNGVLYIATNNGYVFAVDPTIGNPRLLWGTTTFTGSSNFCIVDDKGTVYHPAVSGELQ